MRTKFACLLLFYMLTLQAQMPTALMPSFSASYGNMAGAECADNDYSQAEFFVIPLSYKQDFYVRILDPDCGGELDIKKGLWDTNTLFEIYGGLECISNKDARLFDPEGNYKSGLLLARSIFAAEKSIDGKWISFGPFHSSQGEVIDEFPGYAFFKIIIEGRTGDDTNIYSLEISSSEIKNIRVPGSETFAWEQAKIQDGEIAVVRSTSAAKLEARIQLPIDLKELPNENFNILAEPVDE